MENNEMNNPNVEEQVTIDESADIISAETSENLEADGIQLDEAAELDVKRKSKLIPIVAVAAVIVVAIAGFFFFGNAIGGGIQEEQRVFFLKDDTLMMYEPGWSEAREVADVGEGFEDMVIADDYSFLYYTTFEDEQSYLYYVNLADAEGEMATAEKITSDVDENSITLNDDNSLMYTKERVLYICNGTETEKVSKDELSQYYYSAGKVIYITDTEESHLYIASVDNLKEAEKIAKDVAYVESYTNGFDEITFATNVENDEASSVLYDIYTYSGGEKDRILKGVAQSAHNSDGRLYYTLPSNGQEVTLYDYVIDNLEASDARATEPDEDDFEVYESYFGYVYSTTDWDAYEDAYYAYEAACWRNELREDLKSTAVSGAPKKLYYWDGKEGVEITDDVTEFSVMSDTLIITKTEDSSVKPVVNITELDSVWDVYDYINTGSSAYYISTDDKNVDLFYDSEVIKETEVEYMTNEGDKWYLATYVDSDVNEESDQYKLNLYELIPTSGKTTAINYIGEVDDWDVFNGVVYYFTGANSKQLSDLYVWENGKPKQIDEDVFTDYRLVDCDGEGRMIYLKDGENGKGSLYLYDDKEGKASKVADEVADFAFMNENIFYVVETDEKRQEGDIYSWKDGNSELIKKDIKRYAEEYYLFTD